VADAAIAVDAQRFVMISTDKAVNPSSIMGATKRLAELYVQHVNDAGGTGFAIVRFGNVLGSSGSVLDIWTRQIAEGGPLTVTDPRMTRYFMTIPEAASLVIQSAAMMESAGGGAEVFVLDMGEPVRVLDLARRFAEMHGLDLDLADPRQARSAATPGSIRLVFTGARPGEKLHEELAIDPGDLQRTAHPGINLLTLERPDPRYVKDALAQLSPGYRSRDDGALSRCVRQLAEERSQQAAA
jgi:FlaA1/EpsC-like NDP-sugar epimerase